MPVVTTNSRNLHTTAPCLIARCLSPDVSLGETSGCCMQDRSIKRRKVGPESAFGTPILREGEVVGSKIWGGRGDWCKPNSEAIWERNGAVVCKKSCRYFLPFKHNARTCQTDRQTDKERDLETVISIIDINRGNRFSPKNENVFCETKMLRNDYFHRHSPPMLSQWQTWVAVWPVFLYFLSTPLMKWMLAFFVRPTVQLFLY